MNLSNIFGIVFLVALLLTLATAITVRVLSQRGPRIRSPKPVARQRTKSNVRAQKPERVEINEEQKFEETLERFLTLIASMSDEHIANSIAKIDSKATTVVEEARRNCHVKRETLQLIASMRESGALELPDEMSNNDQLVTRATAFVLIPTRSRLEVDTSQSDFEDTVRRLVA